MPEFTQSTVLVDDVVVERTVYTPRCMIDGTNEATHIFETAGDEGSIYHLVCSVHTEWTELPTLSNERLLHKAEPLTACPHCGRWTVSWRAITVDGVQGCLGCLAHPAEKAAP